MVSGGVFGVRLVKLDAALFAADDALVEGDITESIVEAILASDHEFIFEVVEILYQTLRRRDFRYEQMSLRIKPTLWHNFKFDC